MRAIYVVQHAQSIHHVEKLVGGNYDTSLTPLGIQQAKKIGEYLADVIGPEKVEIISSDLRRAAETANIIASYFNQGVTLDPGFREFGYGRAEGKPREWLEKHLVPRPADGNRLDHRVCEGSETRREIAYRVQGALERVLEKEVKNTVIVSHGFALTFIIMAWLKVPIENMDYCNFKADPGGITLLVEDDLFCNRGVQYVNRTEHLS
ncbi:MAG TPA: histidine phosphatase family protein [Candidatus Bathyarchaeota archaeon]|nr:histidine phosphatase family protein [Candidatus Bathyarchaeota archaeon]